ncbi:MAG TPA: DUF3108 domain-containing protein [Pyrinomonadaceae bacterium]|nr:DUF3108 domain-containing protein [Pyrinomonadaceae bacterium]
MRLPLVSKSLLLLLALTLPASAQRSGDVASLSLSPASYRVGERLTFNVSFSNFISAAHVELQVVARGIFFGRDGIQLRGHVETVGVVNAALFAINNDYTTYVDPQTGLPYRSQRVLREASRTSDNALDFNQPAGLAAMPSPKRSGEFPGTYDFISAVYRLRALPLSEGSAYRFTVRGDEEEYEAELKVTGHQSVKTNIGSFNALASQVKVRNNSSANDFNIRIYFSDDERHVPVLITAKHRAGEIRAELAGSEFLTPPLAQPSPTPLIATSPTQTPLIIPTQPEGGDGALGLPFKVGEQLNFQTFFGDIPAPVGQVTFQVRARSRYFERDGLLFTGRAQTINAAQRLMFVNDQVSSYVDPRTLLPFRTEMNIIEGSHRLSAKLTINQDSGAATTEAGERIEIPVGTHDYVSFFYLVRTLDLAPPRRNAVSMLVNNKPKTIFISALKRETIQLGSQIVSAIQLSLTTDDADSDKFQMRAWLSDDSRRLPLRFSANTQLGLLRADLAIIPVTRQ